MKPAYPTWAEEALRCFHAQLDKEIAVFEAAGPSDAKTYEYSRMVRRDFYAILKAMPFSESMLEMLLRQKDVLAALERYRDTLDYQTVNFTPDDLAQIAGKYFEKPYYDFRREKLTDALQQANWAYKSEMREKSPDVIIQNAVEIALRDAICSTMENYNPPIQEIEVLLTAPDPLQQIIDTAHDKCYKPYPDLEACVDWAAEAQHEKLDRKAVDLERDEVRQYYEDHMPDPGILETAAERGLSGYDCLLLSHAAAELKAAYLDNTPPRTAKQMQEAYIHLAFFNRARQVAPILLTLDAPLRMLAEASEGGAVKMGDALHRLLWARQSELSDLSDHAGRLPQRQQKMMADFYERWQAVTGESLGTDAEEDGLEP